MFPLVQLIGLLFKGVLEQMTVHSLSILIFKESSNWQAKQASARSSGHRKTLSEPENGIFFSLPTPSHRVMHGHYFYF